MPLECRIKRKIDEMGLIAYEPVSHSYIALGETVGKAFSNRKKAHLCEPLEYSVGESNPYCKIENLEY